ncbi:nose resistant to fluoxetine protein 6-like [Ylistrum balloti]|uniref:nose resistant to fluoxetine protein 6-like n=1 Tax=Ylistrum balloti TaxID=509963 RepID=UPI002905D088|nr:nose resistant to fluoxetine protein 6-like [Ylistrum balloti]
MKNTTRLVHFFCILVAIYLQSVSCANNNGEFKLNLRSTDFGNTFYVAGKPFPMGTSRKTEDIVDLSRTFLRDGMVGSLLRNFEDMLRLQNAENTAHFKESNGTQNTNVFSLLKQSRGRYDVSLYCLNDTMQALLDMLARKPYALGMLDADTKVPSGILQGHYLWFGNYDECKAVESPIQPNGHKFTGQYCLTTTLQYISAFGSRPLLFGTCVPSSCSENDVKALVQSLIDNGSGAPKPTMAMCDKKPTYSTGAIIALVVCGILGMLVCAGTLTDVYLRYTDEGGHRKDTKRGNNGIVIQSNERTGLLSSASVTLDEGHLIGTTSQGKSQIYWTPMSKCSAFMTSFSFIKNTEKLMSTSTASSPLSSLNGMRVLSMWWVILGHNFELPMSNETVQNPLQATKIGQRFSFQAVLNGTFSVDTFFFMSGTLVTYLCLKDISKNQGRTRWGMFYFHRFWRLTPAFAFCLMIYATLTRHFVYGPYSIVYEAMMHYAPDPCQSSWWASLLYIQNFYPSSGRLDKICMGWTWYLANDMQFFIISPIFIVLLLRYRRAGLISCVAMIIACVFIRLMTAIEFGMYLPNQSVTKHTDDVYAHNPTYNRPYTRIAPYMVGILLGYLLYSNDCRARLNRVKVFIGWSLAIVLGMLPVYGLYHYYHDVTNESSLAVSALYISCSRLSWALAIAWIIYACATGYGGPVNNILSWKLWAPLGRLTYCAYLVHPVIITAYGYNQPAAFFFGDVVVIYMYLGNLVTSYAIAYIVSMVIEAPMMGLEKVFFNR